jgi:hypothetical protein
MGEYITFIPTCQSHFVTMLQFKRDICPEFCGMNAVKCDKNNTVKLSYVYNLVGCYIRTVDSARQLVGKESAYVTFVIPKPNLRQLTQNRSGVWFTCNFSCKLDSSGQGLWSVMVPYKHENETRDSKKKYIYISGEFLDSWKSLSVKLLPSYFCSWNDLVDTISCFQPNALVYYIFSYSSTCFEPYCADHQEYLLYIYNIWFFVIHTAWVTAQCTGS